MPVQDRNDLIRQIESLQANTGQLETQLAQARNRIGELEAQIQAIPTPGEPRLDELLANPPWATPSQLPTIPPIPPAFTATADYTALQARDRTFEADIARLRTALDNVALATGNSQADIASLRGQLTSIAANPTLVPLGPTAQEVANAIAAYLSVESNRTALRGPAGPTGPQGPAGAAGAQLSPETVTQLVSDAVAKLAPSVGPRAGPAGEPPSADALAAIIQDVLGPELQALVSLPDTVWEAVLGGSRERLSRLWLATLEAL
jgi:prefoldin subunit 5